MTASERALSRMSPAQLVNAPDGVLVITARLEVYAHRAGGLDNPLAAHIYEDAHAAGLAIVDGMLLGNAVPKVVAATRKQLSASRAAIRKDLDTIRTDPGQFREAVKGETRKTTELLEGQLALLDRVSRRYS